VPWSDVAGVVGGEDSGEHDRGVTIGLSLRIFDELLQADNGGAAWLIADEIDDGSDAPA
jgi:hypothetical protein